jgi:hypothetical protein
MDHMATTAKTNFVMKNPVQGMGTDSNMKRSRALTNDDRNALAVVTRRMRGSQPFKPEQVGRARRCWLREKAMTPIPGTMRESCRRN